MSDFHLEEQNMHSIFGLIDPRTMRVFYVGCALDPKTHLNALPAVVANRVAEIAPSTPQIVILRAVDVHRVPMDPR